MHNKVQLIGHIGIDPELKEINENAKVATFTMATSEKYKDKEEETQWHRIVVWNKLAEIIERYTRKGSLIFVEGRIKYRSYEKEGQKVYITEIVGDSIRLLTPKSENTTQAENKPVENKPQGTDNDVDGLPF